MKTGDLEAFAEWSRKKYGAAPLVKPVEHEGKRYYTLSLDDWSASEIAALRGLLRDLDREGDLGSYVESDAQREARLWGYRGA